jgi:hypothetical protein
VELYVLENRQFGWHRTDLTALTGAPAPYGAPRIFPRNTNPYIVYRGVDSHVHGIYFEAGSWVPEDLTTKYGAPVTAGDPMGYPSNVPRVVYRGIDNHIHELAYYPDGEWHPFDMSGVQGPPAAGDPYGYVGGGAIARVDFRANNNHIIEIWLPPGGGWSHTDMSGVQGPPATGDPRGYESAGGAAAARIDFRGSNNHLEEMWLAATPNSTWQRTDMSGVQGPPAAGNPFGYVGGGADARVVFRGNNNHIIEVSLAEGGNWQNFDMSGVQGAPSLGDPMGYATPSGGARVVHRGTDYRIHQMAFDGTWEPKNLTQLSSDYMPTPLADLDPHGSCEPDGVERVVFAGQPLQPFAFNPGFVTLYRTPATGGVWVGTPLAPPVGAAIAGEVTLSVSAPATLIGPANVSHDGFGGAVQLSAGGSTPAFDGQPLSGSFRISATGEYMQDDSFVLEIPWAV